MIVFACDKCKYTDLYEENESAICPRCCGNMVSLGISSAEWNTLGIEEIYDLIDRTVGTCEEDEDEPADTGYTLSEAEQQTENAEAGYESGYDPGYEEEWDNERAGHPAYTAEPKTSRGSGKPFKIVIMIAALAVAGIAASLIIRFAILGMNTGQQAESAGTGHEPSAVSEASPPTDKEYPEYEFVNCLYYDSMGIKERELYQIFYDLVMHKDDGDYSREMMMPLFEFEDMEDKIDLVFVAMLHDHPELFYINLSETRSPTVELHTDNIAAKVEFKLGPADSNENEMIAKFDSAVDNFMRSIDRNASEEEIELQIHDKLNELVSYDRDLLALGLAGPDPAHTAYGAMVDNGRGKRHRAVCDGYAQAYQYLLSKAGICAAQVTGKADTPGGTLWGDAYHAWNIVRLDGEWYEVDCCWDDLEIEEIQDFYLKKEIKKIDDKYFYTTHYWFNRTTEEMEHLPASERTRFFIPGYESFNFIEETSHIREISPDEEWYRSFEYLNNYLPQATGTKYAL